jgi:polyferredoxin
LRRVGITWIVLNDRRKADDMEQREQIRNHLRPWYIGLAIVVAAVLFVGYRMTAGNYPAPTIVELGVLTVVPIVYLVLMYLTFVSQE